MTPAEYLRRIKVSSVYNVARKTPLERAAHLSEALGRDVFFKREDTQPIHSFKLRGAFQRMASLSPDELRRGVVASSAGNHAQGVALAARELGSDAVIVVPVTTPRIKCQAIERLGATLVLHGDNYDEAYTHAMELGFAQGRSFVHPYDHPDTIAGQGTIGLELFQQRPGLDAVFVPVGGGGLAAGVACALSQLSPGTRVVGVEAEDADAMSRSLREGRRVILPHVGGFADGCAVRQVGEETFRICQELGVTVLTVSNDEICAAIKEVFEETRTILEPAGALSVAGLVKWVHQGHGGAQLAAVLSGANLNFDRLQFIAERTRVGSGSEAILAVHIPERPGSFLQLCRAFGRRNLTEFNYRYNDSRQATVFVGISVGGPEDTASLTRELAEKGFDNRDLSQDETAKLHVRHLVGGRSPDTTPERFFRVTFPERPGALLEFLHKLDSRWNISLFHYRNHGADVGRALVAFQVPTATSAAFQSFIAEKPVPELEEASSESVRFFLARSQP